MTSLPDRASVREELMSEKIDWYANNPLIHQDRRLGKSSSEWVRSFSCEDMRVLIVCRGPIRKEAMDVFAEMGMAQVGILLSEKDSITYSLALAPELRQIDPSFVHRVPDYTGATKEERLGRIEEIIGICKEHGYDYIFAGYGFMAEDAFFVRSIEEAGLQFVGPCSHTQAAAGQKDEAKRTALREDVSVTPGINDVTTRALLAKYPTMDDLRRAVREHGLDVELKGQEPTEVAESVLEASYSKGVDLFSVEELGVAVRDGVAELMGANPGYRVRLKAIGGGGGKGQRILPAPKDSSEKAVKEAAADSPAKLREILGEVKATGAGDNKNVLIELNIEQTRHNEIQLLGNGDWCVSLGGRDCSLQMHEQKLLEISITQEGYAGELEASRAEGDEARTRSLEKDLSILTRMEEEAERFGKAVGLDSASTFECIVDPERHFFMEVNTRIQVEHRVSELCYTLRFTNPDRPEDSFDVTSLVEAMALVARHKQRLPRPERVQRFRASVEARLNATDRALQPHAGGIIQNWTDPIPNEIRDDQGISLKNPDTGLYMKYRLAGAYDSNIALLVTPGENRRDSLERLKEVLRVTKLRGQDLSTNLEFHYGLASWLLARDPMARVTTRFVVPYLSLIGQLKERANDLDLEYAYGRIEKRQLEQLRKAGVEDDAIGRVRKLFAQKQTLILRPLELLLAEPHLAGVFLNEHMRDYVVEDGKVHWRTNPVDVLASTYHLLNMDYRPHFPAAQVIWKDDAQLLEQARGFYAAAAEKLGAKDWRTLSSRLNGARPDGFDETRWAEVQAAHRGHQLGLEVLELLPLIAEEVGYWDLRVERDSTVTIPERLTDPALFDRMRKILVPPPATKADEVVAQTGGMFYAQEAPGMPPLIREGEHFDVGQPLYVLEVMKMFNKVPATFAGTVDKVLIEGDGVIVSKGEPLFKVTPDERVVDEDPDVVAKRLRERTDALLERIL